LRKSFLVAGVAALTFGVTGVAQAQTPAPSITVTSSVSPSGAGTKSKPKNEKFKLKVVNNAESKTTASKIEVTLPSTLKLSTSGLTACKADEEALAQDVNECKSSIAGTGEANAVVNPFAATPAPLKFKVTPLVGNKELLFHLAQVGGPVRAVLHGKISGRKMTIEIPTFLQQPVTGTYSALQDLSTTLSKKKGSKYLFASTGCKSKAHKVGVKVSYVGNPNPPAATSASGSANAKCS
jgi:hypothetical protein